MQYIALIYDKSQTTDDPEVRQSYGKFTLEMIAKGFFKNGDSLQDANAATCVSVRNGKTELTNGPFMEIQGQLSGYYILECASLEKAIECAAKIPGARRGTVELRPVISMS